MSAASSRPSRRAATRRTLVESSDDEGNTTMTKHEVDDEEEFDPQPKSPRRQTRSRRSVAPAASAPAPRRTRAKRSVAPSEPSEVLDPDQSVVSNATVASTATEGDPVKKSPRKRKSVVKTEPVDEEEPFSVPTPPTPEPSASPETTVLPAAPLADITTATVNERPRSSTDDTARPVKPMDTPMQRPMDIVLKSRTAAIPIVEEQGTKPRMVISYLILNNFKSYAGRQVVGPFHASFSSVVGPNGSGKSNVIDSLLFVFGFRASKMRQGKISALIHNSAQYPNLDHCEVAVHFQMVQDQPGGAPQVIPDSDLVVSRKAFKNNSSKYYLDGKESNYTTVTAFLRDRGIDLDHKRFLILQGEVESIAQMKSKAGNEHEDGLLEYLEDIIGTSKYKTPIEEAAKEVEELNDLCAEKSNRVQIVEKEKNNLEDKKNKAIAYIRDENELSMKNAALYQIHMSNFEDNIAVTEEAVMQIQARLDEELAKHQGSEEIIKKLEKEYARGSKEFEAQDKETQRIVKEMAKFEQERVKFDEKRKFLLDKRKKLEKTIANAENSSADAERTIEECGEEIESRAAEVADLEEQVAAEEAELTKIRDGLKGKTQAFSDKISAKQKSLEPWNEKINQKLSDIAVAESELNILREKANAGTVALTEMEAKVAAIEEGKAAKLEELKECQAEKARLEEEAKQVEAEYKDLVSQEPRIRTKVSNVRQKADEARSSLAKSQTQGNVLTALMRMKESGRIDGFHGRLGNLGAIDKKYDVAISTACPSLDNFVTDTVEAGQQCIEYLRKTNLGRANFICLDKLRTRSMSPIETPEGAPRLFDLVKPKEDKFRAAFYHAMQDTLVADDLAQANRIAYGARRWRVVTLDGELIDKSGTMSGGGSTVKKGLMSSKLVQDTSKEQVAKLETDRDAIEAKFQEFQDYVKELEERMRASREEIPKLETRMQKINLEVESATRNLMDAHRRIKELSREHQPSQTDDKRAADLERGIAKLNASVEKLRAETASVEAEIKELQDKIMEVGGEKLRAQRAKVDGLKEKISAHGEATTEAEVRRAKAEKARTKLERDHAKASRELEAAAADLEKLEGEVENQGQMSEDLRVEVENAEAELKERKKVLSGLKRELDEKTGELNETRAVEIEMRNTLEENQKVLAENTRYLRHWADKLSKLKLQDVAELTGEAQPVAAPAPPRTPTKQLEDDDEAEEGNNDEERSAAEQEEQEEEEEEEERTVVQQKAPASEPLEIPRYTKDELADMSKDKLKTEIAALEERTQNAADLSVLAEYRRRVEEHQTRSTALAESVASRDAAKRRCDELRRLRLEGFMEGFSAISTRLKEMYQMITMGGNAELELVDSLDPFSEGILFSVMPPKKSWKNIGNLSGGEKTLSSLALVFALHHYKPTPLYVMDEIDAALDFRNVSIVANYIKERTKNAQFIVISLRNNMFELAARLVGVYKVDHKTKSVTIENKDYIQRRPAQGQGQGATTGHGRQASGGGAGGAGHRDYTTMLVGPRP